jgi:hypothetical protein
VDVLVAALALALGLVAGFLAGAAWVQNINRKRRALAGVSAGIARLMPEALPQRSVADIVAGVVRLRLGGQTFVLPVLPRNAAAEWRRTIDAQWGDLGDALTAASDDTPRVVAMLMGQPDKLLAMLRAYDVTNVLPEPEWIDEYATDAEVFLGVIELWRSANPFPAAVAEMASESETTSTSPEPSSSSPTPTAGPFTTSTAS